MIDLEALERLAKAATPRPWYPANNHTAYDGYGDSVFTTEQTHNLDNNLDYIVAACNAVPELVAENRKLQERVEQLERLRPVVWPQSPFGIEGTARMQIEAGRIVDACKLEAENAALRREIAELKEDLQMVGMD